VPVPDLADGMLPEGIHDATLAEVRTAFGVANAKRLELMTKLEELAAFAAALQLLKYLYVDGSFCTDKDLPGDVDVVFETLDRSGLKMLLVDVDGRKLLDRKQAKATWKADVFVQPPPPSQPDWVLFFTRVKEEETLSRRIDLHRKRGILRVTL
jgi:hypothetical protein